MNRCPGRLTRRLVSRGISPVAYRHHQSMAATRWQIRRLQQGFPHSTLPSTSWIAPRAARPSIAHLDPCSYNIAFRPLPSPVPSRFWQGCSAHHRKPCAPSAHTTPQTRGSLQHMDHQKSPRIAKATLHPWMAPTTEPNPDALPHWLAFKIHTPTATAPSPIALLNHRPGTATHVPTRAAGCGSLKPFLCAASGPSAFSSVNAQTHSRNVVAVSLLRSQSRTATMNLRASATRIPADRQHRFPLRQHFKQQHCICTPGRGPDSPFPVH